MGYRIPLFDLNFDHREEEAVLGTVRSRWISMGEQTSRLEAGFARMLDAPHAVAVTNCTAALHLAMILLDIGEGDEVICPSLTFVATVNAVRYVRAVPVFCDVKSTDDLNIDPEQVERLITPRTKAILVMHYAGFPCDMDRIMELAARHGLKVVEDACHGPLSEFQGRKLGTIGDIGCFSFFSNKNISTGEGGMLITGNAEYARRARLLRSHGMTTLSFDRAKGHSTSYDVVDLGYNYRLDDIRASLGLAQLEKLRPDIEERVRVRRQYLAALDGIARVEIPFARHAGVVSNYIFPVVLRHSTRELRESVRDTLHAAGVQTSVHYPAAHRFSIYRESRAHLPVTEYVSDNLITLPMFARLSEDEIKYIAATFRGALEKHGQP